jgi:hypothetical protein
LEQKVIYILDKNKQENGWLPNFIPISNWPCPRPIGCGFSLSKSKESEKQSL